MNILTSLIPWEWLAGIGAAIVALLATWLGGRRSAKTAAKLDKAESEIKARKARDEIETDIRRTDDADVRKRLREWRRD